MHFVFTTNIISLLTLGTQVMAYGKCRDSSATKTDVGFGAIYDATAAKWVGKTYPNDYADQAAVCLHDLELKTKRLRAERKLSSGLPYNRFTRVSAGCTIRCSNVRMLVGILLTHSVRANGRLDLGSRNTERHVGFFQNAKPSHGTNRVNSAGCSTVTES
jgi:hypothetical protein